MGAGDASSNDAILWTRAQDSNSSAGVMLTAQVTTNPTFAGGLATFTGTTDPTQDYTVHIDATGLQSGMPYYYRFVASDNTMSQVGTFTTAPDPTARAAVHFGFTGDADGLMRPYPATSSVTAPGVPSFAGQNFNYFVWLGDTIYETASGSPNNPPDNNSPAVPSSATAANLTGSGLAAMEAAYWTKYRQQLQPVSTGSYPGLGDMSSGLQGFFDSTGHYTLLDNHELGNKQLINGGAPAGSNPAGIGVDATNSAFDVNTTGTYINQTPAFQALVQAYTDYQPIRVQTVNAPGDPRSNGTQQLYFSQQWGANSVFFNLDDRSYRDIRLKQPGNASADDTGVRADNPGRTMLGSTQLSFIEQGLLAAQNNGTIWKIVAISSPIDQIGPIGGSFTINNAGDPNSTQPGYTNVESDGGKSWMGGYRFERNQLLKFIADHHINHVIFLTTDDHQVRINEVGYFTQFDQNGTPIQSSYTRVPGAFQILVGPIGATGPDTITDHSIANIQAIAQSFASQQQALGIDPIGLDTNFPGLINVSREGDPNAASNPSPFDFYSPDTFNYADLKIDPTGQNLTVTIYGMNSYPVNTFPQPSPSNPVRQIMQFTISNLANPRAGLLSSVALGNHSVVFAVGSDQGIWRLDTGGSRGGNNPWTEISPAGGPKFAQVSAGTDGAGQADVYAVTTSGALWKFDSQFAPSGFQVDGPGLVQQASATQGNWAIVLGADGQIYSYNGLGFGAGARYLMTYNSGTTYQSVSASNDQTGKIGIFAINRANNLVQVNVDGTSSRLSGSESIQQVSAGRDSNGNLDAFAVSSVGSLFKFDSSNGYFQADGPGNAHQVSAALADWGIVLSPNQAVFSYNGKGQGQGARFLMEGAGSAAELTADTDSSGLNVFYVASDGTLFLIQPNGTLVSLTGLTL
ncbi:MAG: alkaline phosphatase D family protein [Planctomycetes bacterium]|nr:alkaline phosphatase D family protein [Planctomycetota bacterium]